MSKEFLFICVNSRPDRGWLVRANNLKTARRLLFLYCAIDDPYGRVIRPHHIVSNFRVVKKLKKTSDVNKLLAEWGWLPWAAH